MDDNKKFKTMYYNSRAKTKSYKSNKFWSQKQNVLPENMLEKKKEQEESMKHLVDSLNGEMKPMGNKEKSFNYKHNEFQRSSSLKIMEEVSPYMKKMLLKMGKHIRRIRQSITDITKMNGLYLEEKTKNGFNRNGNGRTYSIPKLKLKRNNTTDEIISNNSKTVYNNYDVSKKDNYIKNFVYVNDNYRKQLNFAFLKYNPISHLDNLKVLVQADPIIRKNITKIKKEIEDDIEWKCDKYHFKKKYLNLVAQMKRSRSVLPIKSRNIDKNKFPKIRNKIDTNKFKKIENTITIPTKRNRKELQKLNMLKEQTLEEMYTMLDASKEINNLIQKDNINDKVEMFKTDYAKKMYYNYMFNPYFNEKNEEHEKKEEKREEKDYFLDEKKKIVDKIGDIYVLQVTKNKNEVKTIKDKMNNENEKFKKFVDDKRKEVKGFLEEMRKIAS